MEGFHCFQITFREWPSLNSEYLWPDPFPDLYLFVCDVYILYGLKKQTTAINYVETKIYTSLRHLERALM